VFQAEELEHPLIPPDRRVRNDFAIQELGRVVIITGSNGRKGTFIKTIGINLVLALWWTGGCAYRASHFAWRPACITDSISDGFSYFAEVKS
jgi:DNA mismatch repair ATPase MutS